MIEIIVGGLATFLTVIVSLPQIMKVRKTKNIQSLSITTIYLILACIILWFIYGIITKEIMIIITNILCFVVQMKLLMLFYKYKNNKKENG